MLSSLIVSPSSRLEDLQVIEGLSNLANIQVNGTHIRSLDGLQAFRNGRYLKIDTGTNRRRNIAAVANSSVTKLSLQYGNAADFDAIAGNRTIRHLLLGGSPQPPFDKWKGVPISTLSLSNGTFDEIANTSHIPSLRELVLIDCRKFQVLSGDNSGLTWVVIQGCKRLDASTVRALTNVEYLTIVGGSKAIEISALGQLNHLRTLTLANCKAYVDVEELSACMPQLESLELTDLKDTEAARLSEINSNITISTGVSRYRAGGKVK